MDYETTMRSFFREITVGPHPGKALEIGGAVFLASDVTPEAYRHGRE